MGFSLYLRLIGSHLSKKQDKKSPSSGHTDFCDKDTDIFSAWMIEGCCGCLADWLEILLENQSAHIKEKIPNPIPA